MNADFVVSAHGSIIVLVPLSVAACEWTGENLPTTCPRWGAGYAIERSYFPAIGEGITEAGLTLKLVTGS